ncbi:MAG: hypothetical protein JWN40_1313 [Phycisphaerales bacterium]|nr:hypothetical protein [Phycisphaerales bacterium]
MSKLRGDRDIVEAAGYVSVRDLPEGGIEIVVEATRERFWAIPMVMILAGIALSLRAPCFAARSGGRDWRTRR